MRTTGGSAVSRNVRGPSAREGPSTKNTTGYQWHCCNCKKSNDTPTYDMAIAGAEQHAITAHPSRELVEVEVTPNEPT